jgi:hypothetical protein
VVKQSFKYLTKGNQITNHINITLYPEAMFLIDSNAATIHTS